MLTVGWGFILYERLANILSGERIAKLLRYCRIMHMLRRNAEAWTPRQGEIEPWMASFDGFVELKKTLGTIRTAS